MDIITLKIEDLNHEAYGVGKYQGLTIFVPFTLPGEIIKCHIITNKKTYAYGELLEIIQASPKRREAICPHFGECGSCDLLHQNYLSQINYKTKMAQETFKRLGNIDIEIDDFLLADEEYFYRNKIQVPLKKINNKIELGYYRKKSHEIVPFKTCYIQSAEMTQILLYLKDLLNQYNFSVYDEDTKKGYLRHLMVRKNAKEQYSLVFITFTSELINYEIINKLIERFPNIVLIHQNINPIPKNTILGEKSVLLYQKTSFIDYIEDLEFHLDIPSFFQVNHQQTVKLYNKIRDVLELKKSDNIIDAYCGVGTISLFLAQDVNSVIGIEVVKEAIEDAFKNMARNKINNADFVVGNVEEVIFDILKTKKIDVLIVDPPRKGLHPNVVMAIKDAKIKKLLYVSCNLATLARDAKLLTEEYNIKKIILVDMFPQTSNVETILLFEIKN